MNREPITLRDLLMRTAPRPKSMYDVIIERVYWVKWMMICIDIVLNILTFMTKFIVYSQTDRISFKVFFAECII
jgi:hypothetical protein